MIFFALSLIIGQLLNLSTYNFEYRYVAVLSMYIFKTGTTLAGMAHTVERLEREAIYISQAYYRHNIKHLLPI